MSEPVDDVAAWMALARIAGEGRGGAWWRLVRNLGGVRAVFRASLQTLRAAGLNARGAAAVEAFAAWPEIDRCRSRCGDLSVGVVTIDDRAYPPLLREILDPPLVLYVRGAVGVCTQRVVAVVGSRRPTRYGRRMAMLLGRELAVRGVVVVSGLATGIDTAAHEGAMAAGLSVAVLAGGLDRISPRSNRRLAEQLARGGALVSENPPGIEPLPGRFPVRNRIITGLAAATVVVEAAERSGSLVSARHALEQGREVFAVPGNIDSPTSRGTNQLIRDGCAPMLELADVLSACGMDACGGSRDGAAHASRLPPVHLSGEAALVARQLESEPVHVDDLIEASGIDATRVLEVLTELELEGIAERVAGGTFALKDGVRLG